MPMKANVLGIKQPKTTSTTMKTTRFNSNAKLPLTDKSNFNAFR
jgi:hypothetical protein